VDPLALFPTVSPLWQYCAYVGVVKNALHELVLADVPSTAFAISALVSRMRRRFALFACAVMSRSGSKPSAGGAVVGAGVGTGVCVGVGVFVGVGVGVGVRVGVGVSVGVGVMVGVGVRVGVGVLVGVFVGVFVGQKAVKLTVASEPNETVHVAPAHEPLPRVIVPEKVQPAFAAVTV
jgi:hypothetical protein